MRNNNIPMISVAMSPKQFEAFNKAYAKTSDMTKSEYVRKLLFRKPITIYYRDRAFDEFIEVGIRLKKELVKVLENGGLTNEDACWLRDEIFAIKEMLIKIDTYVRENKYYAKHS